VICLSATLYKIQDIPDKPALHTLSSDSFCRPIAGKSNSPAGLFPLVYPYVVECAPASPYAYSSSTHRFPDERTPIEATPLSATSAELDLGLGLGLGLDSLSHFSSHALPFFSPPSFHTLSLSPRSLVCGGQPSPHKPRLVVSHSTCPPLSSSPHAHSFVLSTAVINNNLPRKCLVRHLFVLVYYYAGTVVLSSTKMLFMTVLLFITKLYSTLYRGVVVITTVPSTKLLLFITTVPSTKLFTWGKDTSFRTSVML
jgi:hypothetical protein